MMRQTTQMTMASAERAALSVIDQLRPLDNARVEVAALSLRLASEPGVLRAFLARKELRYSRGTQVVLAVRAKNESVADLGQQLQREGLLQDEVIVALFGPHDRAIEEALAAIPGALIYDRSR
jgi:hypothetical protein